VTPRERVLAAIDHRPTDRTPAYCGARSAVTRRLVERLGVAETGGYILCGSQQFMADVPLENILAMYDENARVRVTST
jgi:hypothetical protein